MNRADIKQRAALAVRKALKTGQLADLKKNVICCTDCTRRATEYDHRDYRKPLAVDPVCRRCNTARGPGLPKPKPRKRKMRSELTQKRHVTMASDVHRAIKRQAQLEQRSFSQQVSYILARYVEEHSRAAA